MFLVWHFVLQSIYLELPVLLHLQDQLDSLVLSDQLKLVFP